MSYSLWDAIHCGAEIFLEGYKLSVDFGLNEEGDLETYIGLYLGLELLNTFDFDEEGANQAFEALVQTVEGERYYEEKSNRSTFDFKSSDFRKNSSKEKNAEKS